jgi:hypothetical protein
VVDRSLKRREKTPILTCLVRGSGICLRLFVSTALVNVEALFQNRRGKNQQSKSKSATELDVRRVSKVLSPDSSPFLALRSLRLPRHKAWPVSWIASGYGSDLDWTIVAPKYIPSVIHNP